ncbi:MAG: hypothetical protein LUF35_05540 [Lachnospiraceae bacterium]|nr:hypothetical protein [Lachnospiraceae bacterium]
MRAGIKWTGGSTNYHYTDFGALDGILTNAEMRLNNVLNMNDASEMTFFMSSLCKAVTERFQNDGDLVRARWTEKLFSEEKDKEFIYSAYAACFSCYRDDAAQDGNAPSLRSAASQSCRIICRIWVMENWRRELRTRLARCGRNYKNGRIYQYDT